MTRETLCEDIVGRFFHLLPNVEPDCLELVQHHWSDGLSIFNAEKPGDCYDILVNGPWRDRELNRLAGQLSIWTSM